MITRHDDSEPSWSGRVKAVTGRGGKSPVIISTRDSMVTNLSDRRVAAAPASRRLAAAAAAAAEVRDSHGASEPVMTRAAS
jgi:hypothetical protein